MTKYLDIHGFVIELGYLVTHPTNLDGEGKPRQFTGIAIVVGRHEDEDKVFIRFMGRDMVFPIDPKQLQIIAPKHAVHHSSLAQAA